MKKQAFILYLDKDVIAAFWVLVTAGAILTGAIMSLRTAAIISSRSQYVIMNSPAIHACLPGMTPEIEREMYKNQTVLVMQSILNRGPRRLDDVTRCRKLVLDSAWNWIESNVLQPENAKFEKEQLHQKVELDLTHFLVHPVPKDRIVTTYVEGQLILTGVLKEIAFNEVWDVQAKFDWVTNPNLREKGRFPIVCEAVKIKTFPKGSTKKSQAPAASPPPADPVPLVSAAPPLPAAPLSFSSATPLAREPDQASPAGHFLPHSTHTPAPKP